jgi:hypothetical protein
MMSNVSNNRWGAEHDTIQHEGGEYQETTTSAMPIDPHKGRAMSNTHDSIFDREPVPEKQAGQTRLLAMLFYSLLWEKVGQREASLPHDPSHRYGFLDFRHGWSQCSTEMSARQAQSFDRISICRR